jgi:hypothetical protein
MKISDFVIKIKEIDPRLYIIDNPNNTGLSNVMLEGKDVCVIPRNEIKETRDPNYYWTFPNGMMAPHNSEEEAMGHIDRVLKLISTEEGKADFLGEE